VVKKEDKKVGDKKFIYIIILVAFVLFFFVRDYNVGLTAVDTRYITIAAIEDISIDGGIVAMSTHEVYIGKDLNGDGDKGDIVLQFYNMETGEIENTKLGIGATDISYSNSVVAILTHESYINEDLNGDNDKKDIVLQYYKDGKIINTGVNTGANDLSISNDKIVFLSKESLLNKDLNGDNDEKDRVLRSYDVETGEVSNLKIVI